MSTPDRYIAAATRDNTRRSYQAAVTHFEVEWGGFLPATADSMARYLAAYAGQLSINTLKQRLAALAQWHIDQGFPDPTKAPVVKKVLKGIRELHPEREKQATPLQLDQLEQLVTWLAAEETRAQTIGDHAALLRCRRDRALVLLGFWRAFRSDELCRLRIEDTVAHPGQGMTLYLPRSKGDRSAAKLGYDPPVGLYLPRSKGDRSAEGTTYRVPALSRLCPVAAVQAWIDFSGRAAGPVFCAVDRWGRLRGDALNPNSIIPLLRMLMQKAGIESAEQFSSHSLRRGFATWANGQGWDVKALMEYVGWKDMKSALRYIDSADSFGGLKIEAGLQSIATSTADAPTKLPT